MNLLLHQYQYKLVLTKVRARYRCATIHTVCSLEPRRFSTSFVACSRFFEVLVYINGAIPLFSGCWAASICSWMSTSVLGRMRKSLIRFSASRNDLDFGKHQFIYCSGLRSPTISDLANLSGFQKK